MTSTSETGLVCPKCRAGSIVVHLRMLQDERGHCWGVCSACGEKVKGGAIPRPIMFDAVAKVSESCGGMQ